MLLRLRCTAQVMSFLHMVFADFIESSSGFIANVSIFSKPWIYTAQDISKAICLWINFLSVSHVPTMVF